MQEFINPKSMLTPGVAGSLMMFLVNGVVFRFPEIEPRWLALALSFLIGSVVWVSHATAKSAVLEKVVYWVVNSLVIFVVGFGTTNLGADVTAKVASNRPHAQFVPWVASAFAQDEGEGSGHFGSDSDPGLAGPHLSSDLHVIQEQLTEEKAENEQLRARLDEIERERTQPPQGERGFFQRW